jgi:hypothetical protein
MKRLVLVMVLAWGAQSAQAQLGTYQRPQTSPVYHPPVNPILNTLGPQGGGTGYYTQTRPQEDAFRSIGQLQNGMQQLQGLPPGYSAVQGAPPPSLGITGHPVAFLNYGHYYQFPAARFGPVATGGFGAAGGPLVPGPLGYPSYPGFGPPNRPLGIGIVIGSSTQTDDLGDR